MAIMPAIDHAKKLATQFEDFFEPPLEFRGEVTLKLNDADRVAEVCLFAKQSLGFDYLVDISSVDNHGEEPRFTVVYHLYGYG
ncbi:MAG: NADH-quinone oxidoreductase subunit C, partial [Verrucomicrobia bacterium]|nr:NADH-quinone oxidoreductase subunit C [Verrucomicrobiota bacterium]